MKRNAWEFQNCAFSRFELKFLDNNLVIFVLKSGLVILNEQCDKYLFYSPMNFVALLFESQWLKNAYFTCLPSAFFIYVVFVFITIANINPFFHLSLSFSLTHSSWKKIHFITYNIKIPHLLMVQRPVLTAPPWKKNQIISNADWMQFISTGNIYCCSTQQIAQWIFLCMLVLFCCVPVILSNAYRRISWARFVDTNFNAHMYSIRWGVLRTCVKCVCVCSSP